MGSITVTYMGLAGVNVDKNALELGDNELVRAQNATTEVGSGFSTLRKRAGLIAFNTAVITAGAVLGGVDLPLRDDSGLGTRNLYVGRGPTV